MSATTNTAEITVNVGDRISATDDNGNAFETTVSVTYARMPWRVDTITDAGMSVHVNTSQIIAKL